MLRTAVETLRDLLGAAHPGTLSATEQLTNILVAQHKYVEAERLARPLLAARQTAAPNGWPRLPAESRLGATLAGQHRFDEAEPLLLSTYEAMAQRKNASPFAALDDLKLTGERIVEMYSDWRKPARAQAWKRKLTIQ